MEKDVFYVEIVYTTDTLHVVDLSESCDIFHPNTSYLLWQINAGVNTFKKKESGAKKPSIPYGIEATKQEYGEAEWIQQRNKSTELAKLENILLIRHIFPRKFCSLRRL